MKHFNWIVKTNWECVETWLLKQWLLKTMPSENKCGKRSFLLSASASLCLLNPDCRICHPVTHTFLLSLLNACYRNLSLTLASMATSPVDGSHHSSLWKLKWHLLCHVIWELIERWGQLISSETFSATWNKKNPHYSKLSKSGQCTG